LDNGHTPDFLKWLPAAGAVGGLATGLLYALLRFSYERFYDKFAITPEDIGVNAGRVLYQAAFAFLTFAIAGLVVGFIVWMLGRKAGSLPVILAVSSAGTVCLMLAVVVLVSWSSADDAAACAARVDGQPVRDVRFGTGGLQTTVIGMRAERARVEWIGQSSAPSGLEDGPAVFLGGANDVVFIYLPKEHRTLRVPSAAVAIEIDAAADRYNLQNGCVPTQS
jgi:hypothetical protein